MARGTSSLRGRGPRAVAAVAVCAAVAVVAAGCGGSAPPPPTSTVQRGSVSTKVSASGALSTVSQEGLGFPKGAQLTQVLVKVGDTVVPGQVLAREDNFAFNQALNQERASLNQQQAMLDQLVRSPRVHGDERAVDAEQRIESATEANARATHEKDATAASRADQTRDLARRQLDQAQDAYRYCVAETEASSTPIMPEPGTLLGWRRPPSPRTQRQGIQASCMQSGGLTSAQTTYQTDQADADAAHRTLYVDDTNSRVSIDNARQSVVTAQNTRNSDRSDRRPNIDAQAAAVANAAAAVALAQRDVDNSVLYAPTGGVVESINGAVGEFMTPAGSGTSSLAPGTDAAIPGVGAAATSDQSASNSSISATRPDSSSFIQLNNVNSFQVVVPFEESDAAKVSPGQQVDVTFDAVPDLEVPGTVLSVSPGGVNISGVTNYYATVLLAHGDPRLRDGLTAEAGVLVNQLDNVLVVPNAAIIKQGGRSFVNTPGPDGTPHQTEFQPGLAGDDNTQVLSGLNEGQQIQLPQATVQPSGAGSGGGGSGGGGGGGR